MLFVFSFILSSCGTGEETSDDSNSKAVGDDPYGRTLIDDDIPDTLKFDGETVTILIRKSSNLLYGIEFGSEESDGTPLNTVLNERNDAVEQQLGIKIKTLVQETDNGKYAPTNFNDKVRNAIAAGSTNFDIIASNAYYGVSLANDKSYLNLAKVPNINLTKPWWNQDFVNEMTINGNIYCAIGDASFSSIGNTYATFFNKSLVEQKYPGVNLYKTVKNGDWTIDYLKELVKDTYTDNGDGIRNNEDYYGIGMETAATPLDALFMSCNLTVTTKDSEGMPQLSMYNEKTTTFFSKMYDMIHNTSGVLAGEYTPESNNLMLKKFQEQQSVFLINSLYGAEKLRDVQFDYGILPMPKMDTDQTEYYTGTTDYYSLLSIPSCMDESRLPLIGATLELLAANSYRKVTPAYFEVIMKDKYLMTDENVEMYNLLLENVRYNFGVVNSISLADIQHLVRDVLQKDAGNFTSAYAEKENAAQSALDELLSFY